jgi:hypothetical protein
MTNGQRWTVRDRGGRSVYLTEERWNHIIEPINHPEMSAFEMELQETIRTGQRKQDSRNPQKYRYSKPFPYLPEFNTHIVAFVLFRFLEANDGTPVANNYIVTAFMREIR